MSGYKRLKKYEDGTREVPLADILRDDTLQPRQRLDTGTVSRYAMTDREEFPAVELAEIEGKLCIVDGWHRTAAARERGEETIRAKVTPMTREQAMGEAAVANLRHGLPLKGTERLAVFKLYVQGRKNREGARLKSYRDIEKELPGIARHATLQRWMTKHFPKIAREMAGDAPKKNDGEPPVIDHDPEHFRQAEQALIDALLHCNALSDGASDGNRWGGDYRARLIDKAESVAREMKLKHHTPAEF